MTSDLSPGAPALCSRAKRASRARLGVRGILAAAWTLTGLLWSLLRGHACAQRLAHAETHLATSILAAGLARLGLPPEAIDRFETWLDWSGGEFALGVRRRSTLATGTGAGAALRRTLAGLSATRDPPPSSVSPIALTRAVHGSPRIAIRVRVRAATSRHASGPKPSRHGLWRRRAGASRSAARRVVFAPHPCVVAPPFACPRPP